MIDFLEKIKEKGDLLGLESVRGLFNELGNPQNSLSCIQVVGTNGKGSTCAFMASILKEAGYKVGVYTSPEVFSYYERFKVDGKNISEDMFNSIIDDIKTAYEALERNHKPLPTIFEVETAAAVLFFKRENCDLIIMEAGMGGDLDATNVFAHPLMAVFTSIGIDHVEFLGKTKTEIAMHKTGIIKENEIVVSAQQSEEVKRVIERVSREKYCELLFANENVIFDKKLGLDGKYQIKNASTAVCAIKALSQSGYKISDTNIDVGLKNTVWPGRFEKINSVSNKEIRLDGAHNVAAANALKSAVLEEYPNKKITFILGVLADKDYKGVLEIIMPLASRLITVTPDSPRALEATKLAECARLITDAEVFASKTMENAVKKALENTDEVIVVAGTFTILRDIKRIIEKK